METPLHRFDYTDLTIEQIGRKLEETEAGPDCQSEFSDALVGRSLEIVTEDGPTLEYTFEDETRLRVSEDSGSPIQVGYGALTLGRMIVFSHMIPGAQKGYNVFLDRETNLVTVLEVWFSSGRTEVTVTGQEVATEAREVQREIHFGHVATAVDEPLDYHHLTNRLEGTGMYWQQDTGIETLEFYASVISSNFVELTRHADDLSYCSPSDYVLVDDETFIYDRTECEFSGIMTMYAMDLFSETQVGVRLGFNERDELEYYMFRGTGEVVGELSSQAPFDERGKRRHPGSDGSDQAADPSKGRRLAYRPERSFPDMAEADVHQAAEERTISFPSDTDSLDEETGVLSGDPPPFTDLLAGTEFTLRYDDGPAWEYRIDGEDALRWRPEGTQAWRDESYRAIEIDEQLVFFSHLHGGSRPRTSVKIALDLSNGLTTCIHSEMGTDYYANEVSYTTHFGVAEMDGVETPRYVRHEFTDELVGRGYTRTYSEEMTSMHLYTTPHSSAWTIYDDDQTLWSQWSAPATYVKLRDGVYVVNVVEEACNGAETCIVENEKTDRASGFGFHGGEDGVTLGAIGAVARDLGRYDVSEFFGPRARTDALQGSSGPH